VERILRDPHACGKLRALAERADSAQYLEAFASLARRFHLPPMSENALTPTSHAAQLQVCLRLEIGGEVFNVTMQVPDRSVTPRKMLPIFQGMANLVADVAKRDVERQGRSISCGARCGACCRQLVPLAPTEALDLAAQVESLPESRRRTVLERFRQARQDLSRARLLDPLQRIGELPLDQIRTLGPTYLRLGIACPFLDDESCSIHPRRPIACREYLVTSAPKVCSRPDLDELELVSLSTRLSLVLAGLGGKQQLVPLVLALDWAAEHAEDLPPRPALVWLDQVVQRLSGVRLIDVGPAMGR
jgi:Fe-S-cluster containining protein